MFEDCCWNPADCFSSARYVDRGGEQSFLQPTLSQHSLLYAFFFEGALSNLQKLCDRYLNEPSKGRVHYRPATHFVLVTFGENPELRSQAPSQKDTGFVPEHEVIIWVLTMAGRQIGPLFWVDHLAWFTPYLFVDSSYAMATGREVYGFPKEWGWVEMPTEPQTLDHLKVEAAVFPTFGPTVGATRKPVISLNRVNRDQPLHLPRLWRTQQDCFQAITQELFGEDKEIVIPGLGLPIHALFSLLTRSVPFVFLKQFRDAQHGQQPCYQAIIEADTQLVKFRGGGLIEHPFKAQINNFASHPIVSDFGLGGPSPPVKFAFWTEFDFTIERGKEIVRMM
ncbi:MAG: hypothetical protein AAGF01_05465 [Cyanobacteria bacterium P01_G01_bin.38]